MTDQNGGINDRNAAPTPRGDAGVGRRQFLALAGASAATVAAGLTGSAAAAGTETVQEGYGADGYGDGEYGVA